MARPLASINRYRNKTRSKIGKKKKKKKVNRNVGRVKEATNLGRSRIFQVPKFDVPVTHRHEVGAVLCKRDGLHLGRHLVGGHFDAATPVPHVDNHVVLRANRYHVLVVGRKSLKTCRA
jgi:hypothetical protein